MPAFLFWVFAAVMLGFGAAVVINRNPVASALSLVMCFLGLSALFMSLDAFFIGIIQVLVYAGAVMVLFLFIIMLLDLRAEERRKINVVAVVGGAAVAFALFRADLLRRRTAPRRLITPFPTLSSPRRSMTSTRSACLLFDNYNLLSNYRRAGPRGDHRRDRAEQARTSLNMVTSAIISSSAVCFSRSVSPG